MELKQYIDRIQSLEDEKADVSSAIKEVYEEAKGSGFDPKIMRLVVKLLRVDPAERQALENTIDSYMFELEKTKPAQTAVEA
jgi:uncharacterized protein (UPF0335 family)